MKVQLNWKESSYSKLPELHIAASEIVSDEMFEQMQAHPLWDHDVIQKHIQDMRSVPGGEYCLLIAPENGTDGLLVRSEGSSCARYSAYIPGGRLMTLVTPELERALRKCETAAKEAVRRECMQTLTGKWTCSLAELDAAFGAGLQENKILAELFCDKLARQAEVASAYLEGDMLRVGFRPEWCPRLKNRGRIRVLRAEPGGPVREIQIENRLEAFQKSVGGYIECAGLKDGAVLICDDEGKLKGLRPNRRLGGDLIVGTFLIAGVDAEGDFCSLTETQAERWKKELAEPIKNIESLVQLRDLLQIGLPDNTYLVHRDADIGVCPADGLRLDALPEKIQTAWNDVLAAQVCWIRQGAYGPEIVLAGVDPQRVYDFSFMLIEEIDECPGQAVAPELSME